MWARKIDEIRIENLKHLTELTEISSRQMEYSGESMTSDPSPVSDSELILLINLAGSTNQIYVPPSSHSSRANKISFLKILPEKYFFYLYTSQNPQLNLHVKEDGEDIFHFPHIPAYPVRKRREEMKDESLRKSKIHLLFLASTCQLFL